MLLMSEKLKDKVNVDDLYADDPNQVTEDLYFSSESSLELKIEVTFSDDKLVAGTIVEIEKQADSWSVGSFDSLKIVFITSPDLGTTFTLADNLRHLNITKKQNLVLDMNIEPCWTIITNTRTNELNETVCTLSIKNRQK